MNDPHPTRRFPRRAFLVGGLGGLLVPLATGAAGDDWEDAAPMPTPHAFHTATLLPDGTVLVTGGRDGQTMLDSIARYDPTADRWTIVAPMPTPRSQHAALLLPDGRVFVVGNYQVNVISAVVYDPTSDQWTAVAPLPTPYGPAGAALLPNGQVLALTCDPQRYDPTTDRWSATGPLRASGACTLGNAYTSLMDGRVLVTGGPFRGGGYNDATVYDHIRDAWTATGLMQGGRAFHTATALPDGGALVVGGMDLHGIVPTAERYEPISNRWRATASPQVARSGHTATLLSDGSVLIAGGGGKRGDPAPATTAERYDPAMDAWSDAGMIHPALSGHAAVLLNTGDVLVTGGADDPQMPTRASTSVRRFLAPRMGLGLIADHSANQVKLYPATA